MKASADYFNSGKNYGKGWAATPSDTVDETEPFIAIVAEDASGDVKLTLRDDTTITTYMVQGIPRAIDAVRIWVTGSTPTSFSLWR